MKSVTEGTDIAELRRGWDVSLRSLNRAPGTIKSYLTALDLFAEYSVAAGNPTIVERVRREHVEAFIGDQLRRWRPKTASIRYGGLLVFFGWCTEEGEITVSPMVHMKPPTVPEVPVPIVGDDILKKLLKVSDATTFEGRRDTAILRLFIDCGLRLEELAGLKVEDVDWDYECVSVMGKGSRPRAVPFAAKTGKALDRYLRVRKGHAYGRSAGLWIGAKGELTGNGVAQMVRRRCRDAGVEQLHPHQFRHTAAHEAQKSGLGDSDMMRIFGWRSRSMLNRYGASAADERARDAYKKLAPGDRV